VSQRAKVILENNQFESRYKPFRYLELLALRMAVGSADLIVSRAGAGSISEIAVWGVPSIVIPITNSSGDHQKENAFAFARSGGADVIEERNLTPHILISEIEKLINNPEKRKNMSEKAKEFSHPDSAEKIANEILVIALKHEN